ncbi:MAG: DUF1566 domain-containing protein [Bacteroidia bacterium]|nr:DUF1566 domain-containing protein [Bacteroidia bacterium]
MAVLGSSSAHWSGQNADPLCIFGYHRLDGNNSIVGTETRVGSGEANTKSLVSTIGHVAYTGIGDTITAQYAAKICADYRGGGYDDWFLPSRDELDLLCQNLHSHHLGGFFDVGYYWGSSEGSRHYAWSKHFYTGCNYHNYYYCKFCFFRVRSIRAF